MKKIALALALLLIFSLLASCNEGDDTPEVTTTATTTAATTTVATTTALPEPTDGITVGMSRDEVIQILNEYFDVYYETYTNNDGEVYGWYSPRGEYFIDYAPHSAEYYNGLHIYFVDSNGDNVVVTMTPDTIEYVESEIGDGYTRAIKEYGVVESVFRCAPVEKPELSYDELLQTKLTPEEALEKLGMPFDRSLSSYMGLEFNTSDGRSIIANFDDESGTYYFWHFFGGPIELLNKNK